MNKRITTLAITIFFLTACAPATALPTELPTATAASTQTPVPTNTMTPTLEPWMQSLPDSVASVQVTEEGIFGLNAQGQMEMKFNLENEEWEEVITNIPEWLDKRTQDLPGEYGFGSYQDFLNAKVMSQYNKEINRWFFYGDYFYENVTTQVYVVEVRQMPDETWVAVGAVPFSTQLGLFELGHGDSDNYMPMVNHYHEPGHGPGEYNPKVKLNTPESLKRMEGQMMLFQLVNQYAEWMDKGGVKKDAFLSSEGNTNSKYSYRDLVVMKTPAETEYFLERALSPESSPWIMLNYSTNNRAAMLADHPDFKAAWASGAKIIWALDSSGSQKPYVIVEGVMPLGDVDESKMWLFGP